MAVNKIISLQSGGALILSLESVNVFTATDAERELLTTIGDAVRKYERKVQAEQATTRPSGNGTPEPPTEG